MNTTTRAHNVRQMQKDQLRRLRAELADMAAHPENVTALQFARLEGRIQALALKLSDDLATELGA